MILINDEKQAAMYKKDIEPNLEEGNMLMFRSRLCHPFRPDRSAALRGCDHDRSQRTRTYREKRV